MTLKIYNTLTRQKEVFTPVDAGRVKMYVCGITAYDKCHIGHGRAAVTFDLVYRYLKYLGYTVTFVKNYTDIDDKIISRANKEGRAWNIISEQYCAEYSRDMARLGNLEPDITPKASDHVSEMIAMIEQLIQNGLAYASGGDVYFSVRKFEGYGKLSGKKIGELESGARVEIGEHKADPLDFALWKASKPGEPSWESPWGDGRPGWHIECSCMSLRYLGMPFDIHGGGRDLIFPHHENEIAQSEGALKRPFANYWMHNGTLNINAEKMSKSLGNFFSVDEVLSRYHPEVVRYFLLSSHYRSPLDYSDESMANAKSALDRFYETKERLDAYSESGAILPDNLAPIHAAMAEKLKGFRLRCEESLNDDFNTPAMLGHIFDILRDINRCLDSSGSPEFLKWLSKVWNGEVSFLSGVLALFGSHAVEYRQVSDALALSTKGLEVEKVEALLQKRKEARRNREFSVADEVRAELDAMGVEIKDHPEGSTTWKVK